MTRVFITGPTGCVGAAAVDQLVAQGVDAIVGMSRNCDPSRFSDAAAGSIRLVSGDLTDPDAVSALLRKHAPTHLLHLAAFQTPDCQAQPFRGMDINVGGTMNLLKAAARIDSLERLVLASSSAVYGSRDLYPGDEVTTNSPYAPPNLYGYWKVANEGMAQAFHLETGLPAVAFRFSTTYGPGRDQGLTSAPTSALKAAAKGKPFAIPYNGRETYHYVEDVAAGFVGALLEPFEGVAVFNQRGHTITTEMFSKEINSVAEKMGLGDNLVRIADDPDPYPFACDLDESDLLTAFPDLPLTPIREGIRKSLDFFRG